MKRKTREAKGINKKMKGAQHALSAALAFSTPTGKNTKMKEIHEQIPSLTLKSIDPQSKEPIAIQMPQIGFGTYKFKKGSGDAERAVREALGVGYRSIDTAFIYGGEMTEKEVGQAIHDMTISSSSTSATNISRSDIFLTSKQWRAYHGYEPTLACLSKSLKRLQTSYLDLYLIHWPGCAYNTMNRRNDLMESSPDGPFVYAKDGHEEKNLQAIRAETWRAMEDSLYNGKVRAIGVSNFTIRHLEALKKTARVWPPAINQIELHPYNPQTELVEYCRKEGIVVQAYASLGGQDSGKKTWNVLGGKLLERKEVKQIAEKYDRTEAQVLLRWATQQGFGVIPKSSKVENMMLNLEATLDEQWEYTTIENSQVNKIGLDDKDMDTMSGLDQSQVAELYEKTRLCWVRDPLKMLNFD